MGPDDVNYGPGDIAMFSFGCDAPPTLSAAKGFILLIVIQQLRSSLPRAKRRVAVYPERSEGSHSYAFGNSTQLSYIAG